MKTLLTKIELQKLSGKIVEAEKGTVGEIHVTLHKKRGLFEKRKNIFDLAVRVFHRFKLHQTDHRASILIFILEKDREFQVLADEGISKKVPQHEWDEIAKVITSHFSKQNYFEGLCAVIEAVGKKLQKEFPAN